MFITCLFCGQTVVNKPENIQTHWQECPNKYLENDKPEQQPTDGTRPDRSGDEHNGGREGV